MDDEERKNHNEDLQRRAEFALSFMDWSRTATEDEQEVWFRPSTFPDEKKSNGTFVWKAHDLEEHLQPNDAPYTSWLLKDLKGRSLHKCERDLLHIRVEE